MRTKHFFEVIVLLLFISCKTEVTNEPNNESVLTIEGITYMNEYGEGGSSIDHDDWILNEKFTEKVKQLFDTLDFSKTAIAEPMPITENSSYRTPVISFFPNPLSIQGGLFYYHDKHILNLIVINNKYNKLYSFRVRDSHYFHLNLNKLEKGIYRIYYVIQNSQYNIVHCGHGDIEKE
ncbi:MAG TPA: hypothetical protein VIK29_00835 [Paludibacter sp.]